MTIQRQYTLPNCNLVLEGLTIDANDPLSPMSVLMNVECQLPGAADSSLTGGREFLDNLVAAVSRYAQQILSGINRPATLVGGGPPLVDIKPGEGPYHHLIVQQQPPGEQPRDTDALAPLDVKLSTVQFYDLMEAVDQLLADSQTLPDLQPQFQAISRRLVKPAEPVAKRTAPAAIGAAALAAAGIGLFFVPPPEFQPSQSSQESEAPAETINPVSTEEAPPPEDTSAPAPVSNLDPADTAPDAEAASEELDRLTDAPAITDRELLAALQRDLDRQLEDAWQVDPAPEEDWTYRVAVSETGDILGYKYQNSAALDNVASTPLAELAFAPVDGTQAVRELVAQFEVTFTPDGQVEINPWAGTSTTAAAPESGATVTDRDAANTGDGTLPPLGSAIRDGDTIRALNSTLYDSILAELDPLSANEALEYQVRITEAGDIVGYAPLNGAAVLLVDETPLPDLVTPGDADDPQSDYRVVFTETGVLEVSPWDGWPD